MAKEKELLSGIGFAQVERLLMDVIDHAEKAVVVGEVAKQPRAVFLGPLCRLTVAAVMTVSIMVGIWLVPVVGKKLIGGMINLEKRDKKWGEVFSASLFLGMISAFLGYVFSDFAAVFRGDLSGLIPPLVMLVSAAMMGVCALALKKLGWRWMNDYALPISLLVGMASAIPITAWLG